MSIPIADSEPTLIHAGETVKWRKSISDYPANDGWQLNYRIQGAATSVAIAWATEITADGADFLVTVPAATSANWPKLEKLWLYGWVEKAGERQKVYYAQLTIRKSLHGDVANYDGRTHVQKVLDAIEATILGMASREEKSLRINSGGVEKELELCSMEELIKLRQVYRHERQAEIAAENVAAGKASGRRVLSRYRR
jgi:hypothetical protein